MSRLLSKTVSEPVALLALLEAIVVVLLAFGVNITADQQVGVLGLFAALTAFLRFVVTPHFEYVDEAE